MNDKSKKNSLEAIRFVLFSMSAGLVQVGVFTIFQEVFHCVYWPSYLIALICSVVWNFTINRNFNFKKAPNVAIAMLKIGIYYAIFTPLSTWIGNYCSVQGGNSYLILIITMFINMVTEFCVYKFLVFGKKQPDKVTNKVNRKIAK